MKRGDRSEEQFLCSICLEVFSEPVSTPCGHNFCKRCISQTWDSNESCFCPLCKEVFSIRHSSRPTPYSLRWSHSSNWREERLYGDTTPLIQRSPV
uniref:RING-type domain-containing protein n=1 Tax=Neogobius melanostomus TaxID=47308 RepID=A0A8C6UBE2_9GOBI